jgi:hypothetical protein
MSTNLIPVKSFLGKYYPELLYSAAQDKYKTTELDKFFDQRFFIQNNKSQMIVDPALTGFIVIITGNEIHISKEMYDHPNILVTNSLENNNQTTNPQSLYNPETFSTVAYLVCNNHTMFEIVGDIDEPIYVKYRTEYETFYNSVVVFRISETFSAEIVEEIESHSALNCVTNYILNPSSRLNLTTFYNNNVASASFAYRNIIALEGAAYSHILFGKGSAGVIDENKIASHSSSKAEIFGCINSHGRNFHSILSVQPAAVSYSVDVDYRDIISGNGNITFFPVVIPSSNASIVVSNINLDDIPDDQIESTKDGYIKDIVERAVLERMTGAKRFYDIKSKFLHFP